MRIKIKWRSLIMGRKLLLIHVLSLRTYIIKTELTFQTNDSLQTATIKNSTKCVYERWPLKCVDKSVNEKKTRGMKFFYWILIRCKLNWWLEITLWLIWRKWWIIHSVNFTHTHTSKHNIISSMAFSNNFASIGNVNVSKFESNNKREKLRERKSNNAWDKYVSVADIIKKFGAAHKTCSKRPQKPADDLLFNHQQNHEKFFKFPREFSNLKAPKI